MKRVLFLIVAVLLICVMLFGCGSERKNSRMVFVEKNQYYCYYVFYDRETKVMYIASSGLFNCGSYTVLVNPDGSPMIYSE